MAQIFPSLISGNILNLENQIHSLDPYADGYHLDVMDFHFVPNLTWGPSFINAMRKITNKPFHIHFMICDVLNFLNDFKLHQTDMISFHIERCPHFAIDIDHAKKIINAIKERGNLVSIALKPTTPVPALKPLLDDIDDILLMSVDPGFSGQEFLEITYERLEELVSFKNHTKNNFTISLDGGVNKMNIKKLFEMGVDYFGVASGIFRSQDPIKALQELKELINKTTD